MFRLFNILRQAHRHGARMRGSTILCVCILAFGIALAASMFKLCQTLIFSTLPCQDADNLVLFQSYDSSHTLVGQWKIESFRFLKEDRTLFRDVLGFYAYNSSFTTKDQSSRFLTATVTPGFAEMFDERPLMGRSIEDCDVKAGAEPVVVISESLWRNFFAWDRAVIGKTVTVEGRDRVVIGIMPDEFNGPYSIGGNIQAWVPLNLDTILAETGWRDCFYVEAYIRNGIDRKLASELADSLTQRIAKAIPEENKELSGASLTFLNKSGSNISKTMALTLFSASMLILLMACGIAAGLMGAHYSQRTQEFAIKSALGASRRQLVMELVVEFLGISVASGVLGFLLHRCLEISFFSQFYEGIPEYMLSGSMLPLLGFMVAIVLLVTLLSTIAPALRASRTDPGSLLHDSTRTGSSLRLSRISDLLVVTQIALASIVLSGGALIGYTIYKVAAYKNYYDPAKYDCAALHMNGGDFSNDDKRRIMNGLQERFANNPEVASSGVSTEFFFAPDKGDPTTVWIEGKGPDETGKVPVVYQRIVSHGYFAQMGIPLLAGRDFTIMDDDKNPVAIVTDAFAQKYYGTKDVLGKRFRIYENGFWLEIVGVVPDLYKGVLRENDNSGIFVPYPLIPWNDIVLFLRTRSGDMRTTQKIVTDTVAEVDPRIQITMHMPMISLRTIVGGSGILVYMLSIFTILGAGAMAMVAAGLFGAISFSANLRRHEIGVRMALGASFWNLVLNLARRAMFCTVAGLMAGVLCTIPLRALLIRKTEGLLSDNWRIYLPVVSAILVIALVSIAIPAFGMAYQKPAKALRER